SGEFSMSFKNPSYNYKNIFPNPSIEEGLWKEWVGDCFAYDDKPDLKMSNDNSTYSDGSWSLLLEAANHIACTGPDPIPIRQGEKYLLSFDYKSNSSQTAGYNLS